MKTPEQKTTTPWDDLLARVRIKRGDTITLKKGTPFKSTHPKRKSGVLGRSVQIKVDHVYGPKVLSEGDMEYERRHGRNPLVLEEVVWERYPGYPEKYFVVTNPELAYAGSGGYWVYVDALKVQEQQNENVG